MKNTLYLLSLTALAACTDHLDGTGCDVPPGILFQVTDRAGTPLATSPADKLTVSYQENGVPRTADPYVPYQLPGSSSTAYFFGDGLMAGKSVRGITTYYLTLLGKTDTLVLQPVDECGYNLRATFDGRTMPRIPGTAATIPDYYQLKRR